MKTKRYLLAGALVLGLSTSAFAQDNSYEAALNPIISALKASPNDPKAGKDAVKAYMKAFKKDEKALVALGNVYLSQRNYQSAKDVANLVVTNKKMNGSLGYLLLGDIAALEDSIGNAGAAAQQYQTAISLDPHNVEAYERYARVYRHVNSDVAVQKLEELRRIEPNYPVEATAAEIMFNDRKYTEALEWYNKANTSYLTEDHFYRYGYTAVLCGKYDKAIEVANIGLQKFPNSEYVSRVGMMGATEKGDYAKALSFANTMFAGSGQKVANDYAVYGKALCGNKQYDEALTNLNKALEMDKDNIEPMKAIADVYAAQGNEDKSLEVQMEYLSKSKRANSNDWLKLAQTYVDKANKAAEAKNIEERNAALDKAIDVYESMLTKFPSISDYIWLNQSEAARLKNDADQVAAIYKKVAAFEEAKPSLNAEAKTYLEMVYYGLGYYYSKKGDKATGDSYFKKVLEINPNHPNAKEALGM